MNYEAFLSREREKVIVIAPGSSFSKEQAEMIDNTSHYTISIGDAGRVMMRSPSVLYHADAKWWDYYDFAHLPRTLLVSMEKTRHPEVFNVRRSPNRTGLDLNFPYLVTGNNSGYQAINLAMYCNPKEIILVGYDMKDRDGKHNVIGDHPKEVKRPADFSLFIDNISNLAPLLDNMRVKVYNCTLDSALTCFEKKDLKDVL